MLTLIAMLFDYVRLWRWRRRQYLIGMPQRHPTPGTFDEVFIKFGRTFLRLERYRA